MLRRLFTLLAVILALLPARGAFAQTAEQVQQAEYRRELSKKAQTDPAAATELAYMYQTGTGGVKRDYERAVAFYTQAANMDYADAETNLGVLYSNGLGVQKNYGMALQWFGQAIRHGNVLAEYNLGNLYYLGQGTPVDYPKAVQYYEAAAKQGNADAEYALGKCYLEGKGVKQSDTDAVKWLRLSADQGNSMAERHMAEIYKSGKGAATPEQAAMNMFDMYKKAAFKGDADAQFNYGLMIDTGVAGITPDPTSAIQWYYKAAMQGQPDAQHALGKHYYDGKGIAQDYRQAWFWYALSAKYSHKGGYSDDRDEASQHVPPAELDADELQVAHWKPTVEQKPTVTNQ
jgi:TPR repeat protein